jgi:hypothetical protein
VAFSGGGAALLADHGAGNLGNGAAVDSNVPVQVSGLAPGTRRRVVVGAAGRNSNPALARLSTWCPCLLGYRGGVPPDGVEPSRARFWAECLCQLGYGGVVTRVGAERNRASKHAATGFRPAGLTTCPTAPRAALDRSSHAPAIRRAPSSAGKVGDSGARGSRPQRRQSHTPKPEEYLVVVGRAVRVAAMQQLRSGDGNVSSDGLTADTRTRC